MGDVASLLDASLEQDEEASEEARRACRWSNLPKQMDCAQSSTRRLAKHALGNAKEHQMQPWALSQRMDDIVDS